MFVFVENGLGKNALALGAPPKAFCSERRERKNERKRSADIATRRDGIAVSSTAMTDRRVTPCILLCESRKSGVLNNFLSCKRAKRVCARRMSLTARSVRKLLTSALCARRIPHCESFIVQKVCLHATLILENNLLSGDIYGLCNTFKRN